MYCGYVDINPGMRFSRLTLVRLVRRGPGTQGRIWEAVCDCGVSKEFRLGNILSGNTTSCGCRRAEGSHVIHGYARKKGRTRTYTIWKKMRERCLCQTSRSWPDWGGRGITICARWAHYPNFLADMGEAPDGLTLDRIDNDGPYEPGNCRWASQKSQARNRRSNVIWTIDGVSKCAAEWLESASVTMAAVAYRMDVLGFSLKKALYTPRLTASGRPSRDRRPS